MPRHFSIRSNTSRTTPCRLDLPKGSLFIGAMLLMLGLAACRPGTSDPDGAKDQSETSPAPEIPFARRSPGFGGWVQDIRTEDRRVLIDLVLPAVVKIPQKTVSFNLNLADGKPFLLKVTRYALGDRELPLAGKDDRPTTGTGPKPLKLDWTLSLERKGTIRQWPIYRLGVKPEFWRAVHQFSSSSQGNLTATILIEWTPERAPASPTPVPAMKGSSGSVEHEAALREAVRHLVANPQDLDRWRLKTVPLRKDLSARPTDPRPLAPKASQWAKLTVERKGLYRLTPEGLAKAGLTVSPGSMKAVRIFSLGQQVPVERIQTGNPAVDGVYFYGWPSGTPYTKGQVYWATLAEDVPDAPWPSPDPRLLQGQATPLDRIHRTASVDRDNIVKIKQGNFLSIVGAEWLDAKLITGKPISLPLKPAHPAPPGEQTRLEARLKFYTGGDPVQWTGTGVDLKQTSTSLASLVFKEKSPPEMKVDLPASLFTAGPTTLTLEVTKPTTATLTRADEGESLETGIWLDRVEVGYAALPALDEGRLILDRDALTSKGLYTVKLPDATTDPNHTLLAFEIDPKRRALARLRFSGDSLTFSNQDGWQAEVYDPASAPAPAAERMQWQDDIIKDTQGADYLIITHAMFKNELGPLVELNRKRGLGTRVVDIENIYDLFGDGALSPDAIRFFLAYTALHWQGGAPSYVLLVGDCTSDYLDTMRSGVHNLVPSYTVQHSDERWASDNWFACVSGEDDMPDFMLGRLSVNSVEAARTVIAKTVRYATERSFGPWRARMAYVSDNIEMSESSSQFEAAAEMLRTQYTPQAFEARRIYLNRMPLEDNWYAPASVLEQMLAEDRARAKVSGETTTAIKDMLNGGVAMLDFFGHGAPNIWCDERIWFGGDSPNSDNLHLKSDGHYAFILNYTCNTGAIDYPMPPWNICISEDLMNTSDGGAVGCFVPSGPGVTELDEQIARQWRQALFEDNVRGFGALSLLTRARYLLDGSPAPMMKMFNLLGDPALEMQLTRRWQTFKLTPNAIRPGQTSVQATLEGVKPERGQAQAWLEDAQGAKLWQGDPFSYKGGRIEFPVPVPASVRSPGELRLALYGWNADSQEGDFIAAGTLRVEQPKVAIRSVHATRMDGQQVRFDVTLENQSDIETGEFQFKVMRAGSSEGEPIAAQTVQLAPRQSRQLQLPGMLPEQPAGPLCFEAVVALPFPPDDPRLPATLHERFTLLPDQPWAGLVPELSRWVTGDNPQASGKLTVCAMSTAKPSGSWVLRWSGISGDCITSQPIMLLPAGKGYASTVDMVRPRQPRPGKENDVLELLEIKTSGAPPRTLSRMTLGSMPRLEARLRLKPGSISHQPESPTEGQTVFIAFEVENIGTEVSRPCRPVLLDQSPEAGGKRLPTQTEATPEEEVPALGPGRAYPVRLRWDPVHNAGVQTVWVDANPVAGREDKALKEQVVSYRALYVKTKSHLARPKPPWQTRSAQDVKDGLYKLHVEIENWGETDAHNVEVTFYRNEKKEKANLLGTVPLETVPAKGRREAVLLCKVDSHDQPTVEVRLKGSKQRIKE